MKHFKVGLWATLMFGLIATVTSAQTHDWRTGVAQTPTATLSFTPPFEERNARPLDIHFAITAVAGGDLVRTQSRIPDTGNIYEVRFLTQEGALLEYLTISTGTVNASSNEEAQQEIYNVITEFVYPSIQFPETAEVLGGRGIQIQGLPAIEFVAISRADAGTSLAARIVGVVSPNGVDVVFFVQQTAVDIMNIQDANELSSTYTGMISQSIEFVSYRDESGAVVAF